MPYFALLELLECPEAFVLGMSAYLFVCIWVGAAQQIHEILLAEGRSTMKLSSEYINILVTEVWLSPRLLSLIRIFGVKSSASLALDLQEPLIGAE